MKQLTTSKNSEDDGYTEMTAGDYAVALTLVHEQEDVAKEVVVEDEPIDPYVVAKCAIHHYRVVIERAKYYNNEVRNELDNHRRKDMKLISGGKPPTEFLMPVFGIDHKKFITWPYGGITICYLLNGNGDALSVGKSVCSMSDRFVLKRGASGARQDASYMLRLKEMIGE